MPETHVMIGISSEIACGSDWQTLSLAENVADIMVSETTH